MQLLNSTMLLQNCNFPQIFDKTGNAPLFRITRNPRAINGFSKLSCSSISLDSVGDVLHNKVLVAAAVSAAIGQLLKPLTSTLFYGKKFDFKAAVQSGGFPSTHSSAAVATATCLALERGFSDAIFGLAVVYASLIMYDAQGVRREVGRHATELNKVLLRTTISLTSSRKDANGLPNSFPRDSSPNLDKIDPELLEEQSSFQTKPANSSVSLKPEKRTQTSFIRSESVPYDWSPLKESIGHTEFEVTAGALLGFLVSLSIYPYV